MDLWGVPLFLLFYSDTSDYLLSILIKSGSIFDHLLTSSVTLPIIFAGLPITTESSDITSLTTEPVYGHDCRNLRPY